LLSVAAAAHPDEDTVVDLAQAQQLQDLLGLHTKTAAATAGGCNQCQQQQQEGAINVSSSSSSRRAQPMSAAATGERNQCRQQQQENATDVSSCQLPHYPAAGCVSIARCP
jgi:hypothetical protein